jgi:hypothetical protein
MFSRSKMLFLGAALLAACTDNTTAPRSPGSLSAISASVSQQGNLVLHVDASALADGDGSAKKPYRSVADAVARANQNGGAQIIVAPGPYPVSQTIRIESPLTILGSNVMSLDASGLPTGQVAAGTESRVVGAATPEADTILWVSRSDGTIIRGIKIANLTIEGAATTVTGVLLTKTQDFDIRNNVMTGTAGLNLNASASSGQVRGNYIEDVGCAICMGGGNSASPSVVDIRGNRAINNHTGGILLNGSGTDVDEFADQLDATVDNNDLRNNGGGNAGFGLRIFIIRRDPGTTADPQSTGFVRAVVSNNQIVHNQIGMILDAGFPYRRFQGVCDPRTFSGGIDLTLKNNVITGSTALPALITFTRSSTTLLPSQRSQYKYLHNSTFRISDSSGSLAAYTLDHRDNDPASAAQLCPGEALSQPLGNHFFYNGVEIAGS